MLISRHSFTQMLAQVFPRAILSGSLLFGSTIGLWVAQSALPGSIAHAQMARLDIRLDRVANESYESFVRRAELVARAAIQRIFDQDILNGTASIYILGLNQGAEAPVMTIDVSRQQWAERPDARYWANYYRSARTLLGFQQNLVQNPYVAPTATPAPTQQPMTPVPLPNRRPIISPSEEQ